MSATRVVIIEDEPLFRQLLMAQLSSDPEIEVVGEGASGEEAIELAEALAPEVMLMDIEMGDGISGIQAGHTIKSRRPTMGIVLLSNHKAKQFIVNSGGWSYLLKRNVRDIETVARAVKGAAWGMIVIDPQLTDALKPRSDSALSQLEARDVKILELIAQGFTDKAISEELVIDVKTVQQRFKGIADSLGVERGPNVDPRVAAVRAYLEQTGGL